MEKCLIDEGSERIHDMAFLLTATCLPMFAELHSPSLGSTEVPSHKNILRGEWVAHKMMSLPREGTPAFHTGMPGLSSGSSTSSPASCSCTPSKLLAQEFASLPAIWDT